MTVLIAGGGIAGLTTALTCHQLGVPAVIFESTRQLRPLGVGINLQPNAVRELFDLGLADELADTGIETREWALVARNGRDVYSEPRGLLAGYRWPQYSVHRGELQMLLYRKVLERMGPGAVRTGCRVIGYESRRDHVVAQVEHRDGGRSSESGALLLGADGIHSSVRAQMHPRQGPLHWGGRVMWRGTSPGEPIRSGASFTLVGTLDHRFVHYPISEIDPVTGLQTQNWLAELTFESSGGWTGSDWNRRVPIEDFIGSFEDWVFDWLDFPALVRRADAVFEFPMVDRDPVDHWVDGRVALIGDAAHVMYPTGSNGGSQAIVDARILGAELLEHGVTAEALHAFEDRLLDDLSALVLRNRGDGPIGILGLVEERCGGEFDDIGEVLRPEEVEAYMSAYKEAAGFAVDSLNAAPPIIEPGATLSGRSSR